MQFIFPLTVGLGSYLFVTAAFVALSPAAGERDASTWAASDPASDPGAPAAATPATNTTTV
jgi:hypothetical protein